MSAQATDKLDAVLKELEATVDPLAAEHLTDALTLKALKLQAEATAELRAEFEALKQKDVSRLLGDTTP